MSRVDPLTNQLVATIEAEVPGPGGDIAFGEGFVWVTALADKPTGKPLTKIDPATNKVAVQFVGRGGDALRVGRGAIWMCSFFLEEVLENRLIVFYLFIHDNISIFSASKTIIFTL